MSVVICNILTKLKDYIEQEQYKGYDPFDGLNSKLFNVLPILKRSSLFQLAWIQFFKRSPINFRKIAGIDKAYNPKGLGLLVSAYCNLYKIKPEEETLANIRFLVHEIKKCQSQGYAGICWGYNFDWMSRAFYQPKGTPSVVVTSFIGCALLDAYQVTNDEEYLRMARSACNFVLNDLNRTYDTDGDFSFSYCPLDKTQVFNASLLGVRLLSRTYQLTHEPILIDTSRKAVAYAVKHQQQNGAWAYSPLPFHVWIDNFHTGYNLECIYTYQSASDDKSFDYAIQKGMDYYLNTFFEPNGLPKYYNNSRYPVDLHTTAQLIITLSKTGRFTENKELIDRVLTWSIENMYNTKKSYFYYYKEKYFTIKIPYMRWTQAWMLLGMSEYLKNTK